MKTFDEWIKENHPEYLDENFWKKLAIGGALAGSALGSAGVGAGLTYHSMKNQAQVGQSQDSGWEYSKGYRDGLGEYEAVKMLPDGNIVFKTKNGDFVTKYYKGLGGEKKTKFVSFDNRGK